MRRPLGGHGGGSQKPKNHHESTQRQHHRNQSRAASKRRVRKCARVDAPSRRAATFGAITSKPKWRTTCSGTPRSVTPTATAWSCATAICPSALCRPAWAPCRSRPRGSRIGAQASALPARSCRATCAKGPAWKISSPPSTCWASPARTCSAGWKPSSDRARRAFPRPPWCASSKSGNRNLRIGTGAI